MPAWTFADIPDQTGRTAIVTGASSGIGLETARMLALKGADVILACRDRAKGEAALARIAAERPSGRATLALLDLADLDSVAAFAAAFSAAHPRLDLLVNNAGVMVPPLSRTRQGFELQFGTNHLGHFALTGRLLPLLRATAGARVVTVSSIAHRRGHVDLDDLNWERRTYRAWPAYCQSKVANLMFALELQRRAGAAGAALSSLAAHPGWTATDLQRTASLFRVINPLFAMTPPDGALPTLRAATDPSAASGTYWGPASFREMRGAPVLAQIREHAQDAPLAARLWERSEQLTGVSFAFA